MVVIHLLSLFPFNKIIKILIKGKTQKGEKTMKKMKKILAFALAMVMMFAMNVTVFADTNKVTVKNFSDRENTEVSIYKMVTLDSQNSNWKVADWAKGGVTFENGNVVYDLDALKNAAATATAMATKTSENGVAVEFAVTEPGAYLILATGESVTYNPMVAKAYDYNANGLMVVADATVVAKGNDSKTDKEADDTFVHAGQEVTFTVTTTVPYFAENEVNKEFVVYDQPTNLTDLTLVSATVAGAEVANATLTKIDATETEPEKYAVDLSSQVEKTGATVVLTYTAVVAGNNGYENQAWSNKNDDAHKSEVIKGFTGDITLTKYASDDNNEVLTDNTKLAGATFVVYEVVEGVKNYATFDANYVFTGWVEKIENATSVVTGQDGTLKVSGLDEGTYFFQETVAPEGYSVNTQDVSATIEQAETPSEHVSVSTYMIDTTLSALPATGGIGTTIFTIAGVAIMVIAAGLFFATRRKNAR